MSAPLLDHDVDTIEHLDFEPDIACELKWPVCTKKAVLVIACRKCNAWAPACAECVARARQELAAAKRSWDRIGLGGIVAAQCNVCSGTSDEFDGLWRVEPLKGGV